jgi:hypothetical protein
LRLRGKPEMGRLRKGAFRKNVMRDNKLLVICEAAWWNPLKTL